MIVRHRGVGDRPLGPHQRRIGGTLVNQGNIPQ